MNVKNIISDVIEEMRFRYYGQVNRMSNGRILNKIGTGTILHWLIRKKKKEKTER